MYSMISVDMNGVFILRLSYLDQAFEQVFLSNVSFWWKDQNIKFEIILYESIVDILTDNRFMEYICTYISYILIQFQWRMYKLENLL